MNSDQQIWEIWACTIRRWGLQGWVASLLEWAGPFSLFGAQAVYISTPLLHPAVPKGHMDALARLLEDKSQAQAFAAYLREAPLHEPG
jgi:hypothetical protein